MTTRSIVLVTTAMIVGPLAFLAFAMENRAQYASDGYLVVANWGGDSVLRYDQPTGAFDDIFVPKHSGGMNQPYGVVFGPHDHNLYVSTGEWAFEVAKYLDNNDEGRQHLTDVNEHAYGAPFEVVSEIDDNKIAASNLHVAYFQHPDRVHCSVTWTI